MKYEKVHSIYKRYLDHEDVDPTLVSYLHASAIDLCLQP